MATSIDPGAGDYWRKGLKDPASSHPYRHAKDKITLLLGCRTWYLYELHDVIIALAEKYPDAVLDTMSDYLAALDATGDVSPSFRRQTAQFIAENDELLRRLADDSPDVIRTPPVRGVYLAPGQPPQHYETVNGEVRYRKFSQAEIDEFMRRNDE